METKSYSNYPCSWASKEATSSIRPFSHRLHYAVLTMRTFWLLFPTIIVSPQWAIFGEIRLALNWKLIHNFTKELRTNNRPVLPHYRRTLPAPLSATAVETLCTRRPSRLSTSVELWFWSCIANVACIYRHRRSSNYSKFFIHGPWNDCSKFFNQSPRNNIRDCLVPVDLTLWVTGHALQS